PMDQRWDFIEQVFSSHDPIRIQELTNKKSIKNLLPALQKAPSAAAILEETEQLPQLETNPENTTAQEAVTPIVPALTASTVSEYSYAKTFFGKPPSAELNSFKQDVATTNTPETT
ncbi:MAG: hypothetical protein ACHP65_04285, partial [Legionellales bacterium]